MTAHDDQSRNGTEQESLSDEKVPTDVKYETQHLTKIPLPAPLSPSSLFLEEYHATSMSSRAQPSQDRQIPHHQKETIQSQNGTEEHVFLLYHAATTVANFNSKSLTTLPLLISSDVDDARFSEERAAIVTTTTTTPLRKKKKKKSVSFSTAEIREYPMCSGIHPSVSEGPAITIEWEYDSICSTSVDAIERCRRQQRRPPRDQRRNMLNMDAKYRFMLLKRLGHTNQQITKASRESKRGQKERSQTLKRLAFQPVEEFVERLSHCILNATVKRQRKRQERELLRRYNHVRQTTLNHQIKKSIKSDDQSIASATTEEPSSSELSWTCPFY